jgi:hypothetical protein
MWINTILVKPSVTITVTNNTANFDLSDSKD